LSEHDLKVEHPDKPGLAVQHNWYRYGDDGTFRARGKRVSTEIGTGTDVEVRIWTTDHCRPHKRRPLIAKKAYLLAVAALGWPRYWECRNCDERVYDVPGYLNGHLYDASPGNLKWVPNLMEIAWHKTVCIENMLTRHETEEGCPNNGSHYDTSFMTCVAQFLNDNAYDEGDDTTTGLPRMFHSVTPDQDKVLNDPEKLSPLSNQPYYFH
jgi:hypothetical protein